MIAWLILLLLLSALIVAETLTLIAWRDAASDAAHLRRYVLDNQATIGDPYARRIP